MASPLAEDWPASRFITMSRLDDAEDDHGMTTPSVEDMQDVICSFLANSSPDRGSTPDA